MADKFEIFTRLAGGKDKLPPRLPTPPPSSSQPASDSNVHNPIDENAIPKDVVDAFGNLQTYDDFVNSVPFSHAKGQAVPSRGKGSDADSADFTLDPRKGEPATTGTSFCPFLAIAKFPYKYVDSSFRQPIATAFFDEGKIYNRQWDVYYAWNDETDKAISFIPLSQAQILIDEVNAGFPKLNWQFESHHEEEGLLLTFGDPNPEYRPRFLGCADNRSKFNFLIDSIDPYDFSNMDSTKDRSKEAFKQMMALAADAVKNKKNKNKNLRQERNILNRQTMSKQLLQAQRYLGLLPGETWDPLPKSADSNVESTDVEKPASYPCDSDVVIIAIDVEAYEKAHHIITEVGVSTLDTRDLKGTAPGANGQNWQQFVRARHFCVNEHKSFVNGEFVAGCPENFEFGDSEGVDLDEMPSKLTKCFHEPFSKPSGSSESQVPVQEDPEQKRNIVLLGHDIEQDVQYCHKLGFSVLGRGNMLSIMDTRAMYQAYTRDSSPRGLGSIMADFDFSAWHLHNAGNDAVYTMWAMLAIGVQAAAERDTEEAKKKHEELERVRMQKAVEAAKERVREDSEGWDLSEDGGAPLPYPPSKSGHYTSGGAPLDL